MIRLFVAKDKLEQGINIDIFDNDFDYLVKVMRQKIGDEIAVFNGVDGEFIAKVIFIDKKSCKANLVKKIREQKKSSNVTLAFAPVKNVRIDFVAEKACEMGVNKFQPIITQRTIVDKINEKRFLANIKEAAEQCERLDFPGLKPIMKLNSYLKTLNENQILILCDESGLAKKSSEVLSAIKPEPNQEIVIFIGPEGGFSQEEFEAFYKIKNLNPISLGERILRSDTAIIAAMALINEFFLY